MREVLFLFVFTVVQINLFGQTATMNSSGNWDDAARWASSNIGDAVTETITISNNTNPTVQSGFSYTVGNTTLNQNNTLTVAGTLNIGDASNSRSLTTNNNANVTVSGTLIIWGDVIVNNNINWTISGTVIIKGNLVMNNNANVTVSGNLTINGDFTGSNNTNVTVSGSIDVDGDLNIGNGSNLNGCPGCFQIGGTCTGPASFCGSGTLPVTLTEFSASQNSQGIMLSWTTTFEKDFDYFLVERANQDLEFLPITKVEGKGNLNKVTVYNYLDRFPAHGKNYYRLKSVDLDGSFEYSNVVIAEWDGKSGGVIIYPNPITNHAFTLALNDAVSVPTSLILCDTRGYVVYEALLDASTTLINLPETLSNGVYVAKIGQQTIRVVLK